MVLCKNPLNLGTTRMSAVFVLKFMGYNQITPSVLKFMGYNQIIPSVIKKLFQLQIPLKLPCYDFITVKNHFLIELTPKK